MKNAIVSWYSATDSNNRPSLKRVEIDSFSVPSHHGLRKTSFNYSFLPVRWTIVHSQCCQLPSERQNNLFFSWIIDENFLNLGSASIWIFFSCWVIALKWIWVTHYASSMFSSLFFSYSLGHIFSIVVFRLPKITSSTFKDNENFKKGPESSWTSYLFRFTFGASFWGEFVCLFSTVHQKQSFHLNKLSVLCAAPSVSQETRLR